ncbi:MAG: DNA-binding domain-containing protein [Cyanobacteriota bacterium]
MNTVQLGVRIPSNLNERLTSFMFQTGMSKTHIVINAFASYMGRAEELSLIERMARGCQSHLCDLGIGRDDPMS